MKSIHSIYTTKWGTLPAAVKTTTTFPASGGLDLGTAIQNKICIDVGAYTDGTHTFSLQDSPDGTTFTNVDSSLIAGTMPVVSASAGQNQVYQFGYLGTQRYIQVIDTVTGSPATGMVVGVHAEISDRKLP